MSGDVLHLVGRTSPPVPAQVADELLAAESVFDVARAEYEAAARRRASAILDATDRHGLSRRQVAEVLGLSPMRIQQLVEQARQKRR